MRRFLNMALPLLLLLALAFWLAARVSRPPVPPPASPPTPSPGRAGSPSTPPQHPTTALPASPGRAGSPSTPPQHPSLSVPPVASFAAPAVSHADALSALLADQGSLPDRLAAADRLPPDLPQSDLDALYAFLPRISHLPDLLPDARAFLAEVVFEALRRQACGTPDLAEALRVVYRDPTADPLIRDYAVQHIGHWYDTRPHDPAIDGMLWEAAAITSLPLAGSALIALDRLEREGKPLDSRRLLRHALSLLDNPPASIPARMAALDVCARRDEPRVREHARALARHGETLPLRLAAIAALGQVGEPEDAPFLNELAADQNDRHAIAARQALRQLEQRTHTHGKGNQ